MDKSGPLNETNIPSDPVSNFWVGIGHVALCFILVCIFYIVLTPIGSLLRLVKDPMRRGFSKSVSTYRIFRRKEPTKNSMEKIY